MRTQYILDVRSPREFAHSHIPHALSFPVMNDLEYQEIGTLYRQNTFEAKRKGSAYICQNIAHHLQDQAIFHPRNKLILYCARGGQRSMSFWRILHEIGFDCERIEGGYKTYRHQVLSALSHHPTQHFITLYGMTGCAKSELIKRCSSWSIDIEGLSQHYGSSFGDEANGFRGQPSQAMFENLLHEELQNKQDWVLIEGESKKLGKIILPTPFFEAYHQGIHVEVSCSFEQRVQRIVQMYSSIKAQDFLYALEKIRPYIQKNFLQEVLIAWNQGDFERVASILLEKYYDKVYRQKECQFHICSDDLNKATEEIQALRCMLKSTL